MNSLGYIPELSVNGTRCLSLRATEELALSEAEGERSNLLTWPNEIASSRSLS